MTEKLKLGLCKKRNGMERTILMVLVLWLVIPLQTGWDGQSGHAWGGYIVCAFRSLWENLRDPLGWAVDTTVSAVTTLPFTLPSAATRDKARITTAL